MTANDYMFWGRLRPQQRTSLAADCRSQILASTHQGLGPTDSDGDARAQIAAFAPSRLASEVTTLYRDPSNAVFDIADACEDVIDIAAQQQDNRQTSRSVAQTDRQTARETRVLASVKNGTFVATDGDVRAYMKADTVGYAIRSVDCIARATCTIAFDDVDPEHHPILSKIFGSSINDPEVQLIAPMTELFNALFSDASVKQASLTSWVNQQTVGGKVVLWPVLTVSCSRSAATRIAWSDVTPAGLKQLCSYTLFPRGSPT
jgi:hypothetical protein